MGRDKARLPWRSATLIDSVAAIVAEVTGSAATVGGDPVPGLRYVRDLFPGFGPVSGIAAALRDSASPWTLVVACDMPGLTVGFLTDLVHAAQRSGAVPVTPDGRMHPLCAVWSAGALPAFEEALADGEHTLRNVVSRLDVTFPGIADTGVLRNVNTPEEYAEAVAGARE
jgi:molybdopterin-guanine dinucleotide biosynthesis protein A